MTRFCVLISVMLLLRCVRMVWWVQRTPRCVTSVLQVSKSSSTGLLNSRPHRWNIRL